MVVRAEFEHFVQEALDHLYDPADMLAHPLTTLLLPRPTGEPPGPALHRLLRDAIGQLKPHPDAPIHSPSWRSYRYLSLRYVEMLTIGQVASELGISPRQCRRDHHEALAAVTSILWDTYSHRKRAGLDEEAPAVERDRSAQRREVALLESEIEKIGSTSASVSDLTGIVEGVVGTLGSLAVRKRVDLRAELPTGIPPVVADRTVLRQMLLELVLDAIDQGSDGQVRLAVTSAVDPVRLAIAVRRATSVSATSTDAADAPSTRLAVSRRLADMQGIGLAVELHSDGRTISLSFPSGEAQVVLVVDDNADVIHLFRHYLDGLYDVREAASGEQALELARQLQPRIITLDVMMPDQDGWEVLQLLKLDPQTTAIPIIVCSVLRERELALSLGAADFLAKPITGQELVAALQRCRLAS